MKAPLKTSGRTLPKFSRCLVIAAGVYALGAGLITLLGWMLDSPRLTDWNNSGISMFPNAAVCAALAVALFSRRLA